MLGILINTIRHMRSTTSTELQRFRLRFGRPISVISSVVTALTVIASAVFLTCFIIYIGYNHNQREYTLLMRGVRVTQIIFLLNVAANMLFNDGRTFRGARILSWILNIGVILTVVAWIHPRPAGIWIPFVSDTLYSHKFLFAVMVVYSLTEISYAVMTVLSRRTNPSLMLSGSFVVLIVIGTFLLMLPKCTYYGISFHDALFLSTSAVCITGLTPVDISVCLTPFGTLILAVLMQTGAFGVLTFTSFFALFFTGSTSIYSQLLLRDVIYSKSMSSLIPTLLYILGFTLAVEAIGAGAIFLSIHGTLPMTTEEELLFCCFHSMSAFCNAGFSNLPGGLSNPALLYGSQSFYWVMSALIVAGAIGFPILVNIRDVGVWYVRRIWYAIIRDRRQLRPVHIYSMNTKIVLVTFFILFAVGAVAFFLLERGNTLAGMTTGEQITQSVFNSVTPRSAGFSSVDPARFLSPTLVIVMFLMWVGGASQSTAGGVKVNTLAAIVLNLKAIVSGRERVTAFRRTVSIWSIRRANAVVAVSILSYMAYSTLMLILEPQLSVRDVLFETLSALFTVGSSLGCTASLSDTGKIVLATAMFLGRVGLLSLVAGFIGQSRETTARYPSDNLIIN